jgi:hypothetical protein
MHHHNIQLFTTLVHDRHNALLAEANTRRLLRQHRPRARWAPNGHTVARVDVDQR